MVGNLVVNVTLSKWFVERRGGTIAMAAMGASLAVVVWPPLMTWIIDQSDWRGGWQAMSVITLVTPSREARHCGPAPSISSCARSASVAWGSV